MIASESAQFGWIKTPIYKKNIVSETARGYQSGK